MRFMKCQEAERPIGDERVASSQGTLRLHATVFRACSWSFISSTTWLKNALAALPMHAIDPCYCCAWRLAGTSFISRFRSKKDHQQALGTV